MKYFYLFPLLLFISLYGEQTRRADPLIVAVFMVKDEAPVIVKTLQPLVEGGIDAYFIFDTGSTDNTRELAEQYLTDHAITDVRIVQEPFVDFAVSRNRALDLAEEAFPQATFMLMPDAEWCLCNAAQLVEFCKQKRDDTYHTGYQMRIINNKTLDYVAPRLIRCRTNTRFKGAVHEYLAITCEDKVPNDIYFDWVVTRYGGKKSQARWLRDKDILLRSYQEDPEDSRTVFYLGQTYACLGDWQSAYDWYLKRTKMAGTYEENFVTFVRLGDVTDQLGKAVNSENPEKKDRWQEALSYYLKAFAIMPHRIEPLIKIANHYIDTHEYALAYLFARRAIEIPYPQRDCLFIEKEMYDYARYDIIGRVAWYIGEYEMGEQALYKALEKYPDMPHLHRNLAFYLERKQELEKQLETGN